MLWSRNEERARPPGQTRTDQSHYLHDRARNLGVAPTVAMGLDDALVLSIYLSHAHRAAIISHDEFWGTLGRAASVGSQQWMDRSEAMVVAIP